MVTVVPSRTTLGWLIQQFEFPIADELVVGLGQGGLGNSDGYLQRRDVVDVELFVTELQNSELVNNDFQLRASVP